MWPTPRAGGWRTATVVDHRPARPAGRPAAARRGRPDGPHARAALRRPADRARRLHGAALVLDRVGAGRSAGGAVRRAARRRRGLEASWPTSPSPVTRSRCAGRSAAGSPGTGEIPALLVAGASASCRSCRCSAPRTTSAGPTCCGWRCPVARWPSCPTRTSWCGRRPDRAHPRGTRRASAGRLTEADLVPLWEPGQTAYVCGSASFAEAASQLVVAMGPAGPGAGGAVRAERVLTGEPRTARALAGEEAGGVPRTRAAVPIGPNCGRTARLRRGHLTSCSAAGRALHAGPALGESSQACRRLG